MKRFPIGLQPYTIREELGRDYTGSIERAAQIGFTGIELGRPPEGMTVAEQKALLDRVGLRVIGSHGPFNNLDFSVGELADYLEEVGGQYISVSLRFESLDDLLRKAETLNRHGEAARSRGIQLLYHNHNWEFERFGGEYALDLLLRETDPALVHMEMDTYWVKRGGEDPADFIRSRLSGRCPLLHIKDVEAGEEQFFAEIGEGILDFEAIFRAAEEAGTKWLIVEQDASRRPAFESLSISYGNLSRMNVIERP
ncbi:sugar phosphate isomerase/epimerase family protein [Paenibacillus humicola]|uniref:sugar phosphate isomerase/epimerase family protein n=1 Tax=Paenibacillus humicola TaxID=3110540 RepID=UPI00237A84A9|nr:sugar phosphate isomerase/epimerase [Paenibacillus humicola]